MAYVPSNVSSVIYNEIIDPEWGNSVDSAIENIDTWIVEQEASFPATSSTWVDPISAGITVGDGAVYANYVQLGPLVFCQFRFIQGTTGGVTGDVSLLLPFQTLGASASVVFGDGWASTAGARYSVHVGNLSSTTVLVRLEATNSSWATNGNGAVNSVAWSSGSQLACTFAYLVA